MADHHMFAKIVLILVLTVVLISISRRAHVPAILNYIAVGVLVGPFGLGLVQSEENVKFLAEFGVVFLLFAIGLEFSLSQMVAMRKAVFGLGASQVFLTGLIVFLVSHFVFVLNLEVSLVVASAFALSSTAIVIKQLTEQSEIQTRHGRATVGILIFQDIIAIPLLILIPALGSASGDTLATELGLALFKGLIVVIVILLVGRYILRPIFHEVASSKSQELFTLTVLTMVLAAAAFTEEMGISMTLGAFMAGMMLGETEYRHQIEADIRPFQDILLGLFFITVGMIISPALVLEHFISVILITLGIILLKITTIFFIMKYSKQEQGVALRTALSLGQVGEFGLVLVTLALSNNLLTLEFGQLILTSAVLSMVASPFIIKFNGEIAKRICKQSYTANFTDIEKSIEEDSKFLKDHVVILGFGRVGQTTAKFLSNSRQPFVALDMDIRRVQEAAQSGEPVYFGDSAKESVLKATNIRNAKVAIISFNDHHGVIKTLKTLKHVAPNLPVLVRTKDDTHLQELITAGATEVIPDTFESSIMFASHLLVMLGQPGAQVLRQIREARKNRYGLLEGLYPGDTDIQSFDHSQVGQIIQPILINESAFAVGKTLEELNLEAFNVVVKSVKRGHIRGDDPDPNTVVRVDDALIIQGLPEEIEQCETYINSGVS